MRARFSNTGRLCVSMERLHVPDTLRDEFTRKFVSATGAMKLSAAIDYSADMGSLVFRKQLDTVIRHVEAFTRANDSEYGLLKYTESQTVAVERVLPVGAPDGIDPARYARLVTLVKADLTDPEATDRAVEGSEIAYLTVGLPMDSELWERQFPVMMRNVIDACAKYGTRLVFFDNTHMYPGTTTPQTESTGFAPNGRKGRVRARIATTLLEAMAAGTVDAVICRAPEFYGPGKTKSLTDSLVLDRIEAGKRPFVPVSAKTVRSLIRTPDADQGQGPDRQHPRRLRPDLAPAHRPPPPHLRRTRPGGRRGHRPPDPPHRAAPGRLHPRRPLRQTARRG